MPIIPVRNVGSVGLVSDIPSVLLPPQAWSNCNNVRFDNQSVNKIPGHQEMFNLTVEPHVLQYWPRPVTPFYIYGTSTALFRVDGAGNTSSITRTGANYDTDGIWHSTLYNGGYTVVLNNTIDTPQYITYGTSGAIQETMLQDLPGFPASTSAGVVRSAGYALIAGNLTDTSGSTAVFRPGTILVSSQAAPGGIPASWTVGSELLTTADEFDLSQTSPVLEFVDLRGYVMCFTGDSIHQITLATPRAPTRVQNLNNGKGILATNCAVEIDGSVFVVDRNDIYVTGGTGSVKSVADEKVRDLFFSRLNSTHFANTFVTRNTTEDEVWINYPSIDSTDGRCDEALIWNHKQDTWTRRDLPLSRAGTFGPLSNGTEFVASSEHIIFTGYRRIADTTTSSTIHVGDLTNQFNGDNFEAYVERTSLDMGDLQASKWASTVYPLIDGTGSVDLSAGTSNVFGVSIDLATDRNTYSNPFVIGEDYKKDTRQNGRFVHLRFGSNSADSWRLAGFSLNAELNDKR